MIHVNLQRFAFGAEATGGVLFIGGELICFTLEDQVRPDGMKVYGETAIPYGTYELGLRTQGGFHQRYKQRFADNPAIDHVGMIEILNVPDFKYVLFHCGNTDEDTAGCILMGRRLDLTPDGDYPMAYSTEKYIQFYNNVAPHLSGRNPALLHVEEFKL